ncbi:hypothetical protein [Chryseobacterium sp. SIMBA_029]|uniref:hypothetical protein n=1 Tax=Chryseobacterium sp. SIMBA_029 TaxID=3085772 RepID=UPI0039794BBD
MELLKPCIPFISNAWKEKYKTLLAEEHLERLGNNIEKYKENTLDLELPYFNEELPTNREKSFKTIITILEADDSDQTKAHKLEQIPFEYWLDLLGQRLTSASIRDENAIPPLRITLIESCMAPFNHEITIAQRAWEKHVGRMDDLYWGKISGNNEQKQKKVMAKINEILDHTTWWNVFYHYKHGLVYEVREKGGHGIRWSHGGQQLIGFLEVFINE